MTQTRPLCIRFTCCDGIVIAQSVKRYIHVRRAYSYRLMTVYINGNAVTTTDWDTVWHVLFIHSPSPDHDVSRCKCSGREKNK